MMKKDTSKIIEELQLCANFSTFYDKNKEHMVHDTLSQLLNQLIQEKKLKKSEVIKRSELSEVYSYQIFSGLRIPDRSKLLCLALGMSLDLNETQALLKSAGYPPLYAKRPFDSIILYGICQKMSIAQINDLLFGHDLETLG